FAVLTVRPASALYPLSLHDALPICLDAQSEVVDLRSGIVVVELARHFPTGPFERRCDGVAQGGLASMPNVEWACGIRRHEFDIRSEEHTSELQSRVDIVCRLLLEKK